MGGGGQGSSKFAREGTGIQTNSWSVPQGISDLITGQLGTVHSDPALGQLQTNMFSNLMQDTPESQPGWASRSSYANMSPTGYTGYETLRDVGQRNPYDSSYEADTLASFKQRSGDAMAQAASGPDA